MFAPPDAPAAPYTWGRPDWLPWCLEEQRATRERVAVFDQTSFSLYDVTGADARQHAAVDLRRRRRRPGRRLRLHAVPQRARHLRGRPDRHPHRRRPPSSWCRAPRRPIRDLDWIRTTPGPGRRRRGRRPDRRAVRDRRDGPALPGAARARVRRGLVGRGVPVRDQPGGPRRGGRPARDADDLRRRGRLGAGRPGGRRTVGVRRAPFRGRGSAASPTRATTRSSRCGWRRATARSVATSPPTSRRSRRGCSSRRPWAGEAGATRTSSGGQPWPPTATGSAGRVTGAVWCRSSSRTPSRWCGAASCCCATASPAGQVTSAAYGATVGASVGLALLRADRPVRQEDLDAVGLRDRPGR